jgi:hypothetical protein
MSIKLEVSIGEALDKLTILDIKKDKIVDVNNKADVVNEYNYLYEELKKFITNNYYYYCLLKKVNLEIWDLMDIIRTPIDKETYYLLCDITVNLNDSRFLLKKKINALSESKFKEQKGYKKRCLNIVINTNQNVFILLLGAIRYYSLFYDEVYVYIKNLENYNNELIDPYIFVLPLIGPNASTDPIGPNASTDPIGPNASTDPIGPTVSTDPIGPNVSTDPIGPNASTDPISPIGPTASTEGIFTESNHDYIIVDNNTNGNVDINITKRIAHTYFINKKKYSNGEYKETSDILINEIYKKLDLDPSISLEY